MNSLNPNSDFSAEQEEPKTMVCYLNKKNPNPWYVISLHEYPLQSIIILYFCIITFDLIIKGTGFYLNVFA